MSQLAWYEQPRWATRLMAEAALMRERFPAFRLVKTPTGELKWLGQLCPVGAVRYVVSIAYPHGYPYQEPTLRVEAPSVKWGAPHVYANGSICAHREGWNAERTTAVGEVGVLAAWLVAYENWLLTGEGF